MKTNFKRKLYALIVILFSSTAIFGFGVAVGQFHLPPYSLLKQYYVGILSEDIQSSNQQEYELLKHAFVEKVVADVPQQYPDSKTIQQISERINEYFLDTSLFENAYSKMEILECSLNGNLFELTYKLGKIYKAHAYFLRKESSNDSSFSASLVIPGSGQNQASEIFKKNKMNGLFRIYVIIFVYLHASNA